MAATYVLTTHSENPDEHSIHAVVLPRISQTQSTTAPLDGAILVTDKDVYRANGTPRMNGDGNAVIKVEFQNRGNEPISLDMDSCEGRTLGLTLEKSVDGIWRQAAVEYSQHPCHIGPIIGNTAVRPDETVAEIVSDDVLIPSSTYRFSQVACRVLATPGDQCSVNDPMVIYSNVFTTAPDADDEVSGVVVPLLNPDGDLLDYGVKEVDGSVLEMESDSVDVIADRYVNREVILTGYLTGALWHGIVGYQTEIDGGFYVSSIQGRN